MASNKASSAVQPIRIEDMFTLSAITERFGLCLVDVREACILARRTKKEVMAWVAAERVTPFMVLGRLKLPLSEVLRRSVGRGGSSASEAAAVAAVRDLASGKVKMRGWHTTRGWRRMRCSQEVAA